MNLEANSPIPLEPSKTAALTTALNATSQETGARTTQLIYPMIPDPQKQGKVINV